jgi:PPOX class probable F420-dependent enzyme
LTDEALTVHAVLPEDLREWLTAELRYPVLAVLTPDGSPNQSIMWFDLDPDEPDVIVMNTKVGRAKERYLRNDPRISVCFEDGMFWVALQGIVELDDDRERSLETIKSLARRYGSRPEQFDGQERVDIRIKVTKVIRHD